MPLASGTIELMTSTPTVLRALLDGLPLELLTRAEADEWPPATIAAHLLDRGRIQRGRVEAVLETHGARIEDSDEGETLRASGLREWPLAHVLDAFRDERTEDMKRYSTLTDAELARSGEHSAIGTVTVAQLIHQAAFHDLIHTRQIVTALTSIHRKVRGGFSAFD